MPWVEPQPLLDIVGLDFRGRVTGCAARILCRKPEQEVKI
jgi:hypothetical protein